MMFLTKVSLWDVVEKQLRFKVKSYRGTFTSLMVLQIIGLLFSVGGEGGFSGGSDNFSYAMTDYSSNILFALMMMWSFISAIVITTKAYRFDDYTFVANRMSSHIANIFFICLSSIIGGITFLLASQSIKLVSLFIQDSEIILTQPPTILQLTSGTAATIFYLFLFAAIGYLVGTLVQKSRLFVIILPAGFIGLLFLNVFLAGESDVVVDVGQFFGRETSFLLFAVKVLVVSALAFAASLWMSNRMEVRQ